MSALDGRVALVTGATHNLGRAIAEQLVADGASVIVHGRERADAERVARELGAAARPIAFDLGAPAAIADGFAELDAAGVLVDVLVANAAHLGLHERSTLEQPLEFFDEVVAVNVTGLQRLALHSARRLVARGRPGAFVVISSLAGERAIHDRLAYNTTKAAADGLVRSLALDLAPHGIRVNGIAPGFVWSDRWEVLPAEEGAARRALIPAGEPTTREELARLVAFLASDAVPTLTGERLVVDGGLAAQQGPPPRRDADA